MKKNVLYLTPVFEDGGTEVYILSLIKFLLNLDYNIKVVSSGGVREKKLADLNVEHKILKELRKKNPLNFLKSSFILRKYIIKNKIDIIHSSSIYTLIIAKFASLFLKRIRTVYTMHGGTNREVENSNKFILNYCVDNIIVLSKSAKEILESNGVKKNKLTLIYNGIEDANFEYENLKRSNKINILNCGRLTEQKGQINLIKASSKIERDDFEVNIIGDGELKDQLQKEIDYLEISNKVQLLGFKENVLDYVVKADIFVLPSIWEQFPISILEAMMLKKPIIATNVNGIPEEIGDCGILVEPNDIKGLEEAMQILMDSPKERAKLGEKAYKRYKKYFTVDIMAKSTIKVYEKK